MIYYKLAASPRRHILIVDHMDRRPPVLAPSALGNYPPVQNWIEEEQGSIILRSGTVSEAPYIRIATP